MTHLPVQRGRAAALSLLAAAVLSACGGGGSDNIERPAQRDQIAAVPSVISAEMLLQWAESAYPGYFQPPGQATQSAATYSFRHYPYTGNFLAVAGEDVFVLGAFTGFEPRRAGSLADYRCDVLPSACWSGAVPVAVANLPVVHAAAWPSKAYVVRDAQAWAAAWAERENFAWPEPALPTVDFSRHAVLGGGEGNSL